MTELLPRLGPHGSSRPTRSSLWRAATPARRAAGARTRFDAGAGPRSRGVFAGWGPSPAVGPLRRRPPGADRRRLLRRSLRNGSDDSILRSRIDGDDVSAWRLRGPMPDGHGARRPRAVPGTLVEAEMVADEEHGLPRAIPPQPRMSGASSSSTNSGAAPRSASALSSPSRAIAIPGRTSTKPSALRRRRGSRASCAPGSRGSSRRDERTGPHDPSMRIARGARGPPQSTEVHRHVVADAVRPEQRRAHAPQEHVEPTARPRDVVGQKLPRRVRLLTDDDEPRQELSRFSSSLSSIRKSIGARSAMNASMFFVAVSAEGPRTGPPFRPPARRRRRAPTSPPPRRGPASQKLEVDPQAGPDGERDVALDEQAADRDVRVSWPNRSCSPSRSRPRRRSRASGAARRSFMVVRERTSRRFGDATRGTSTSITVTVITVP